MKTSPASVLQRRGLSTALDSVAVVGRQFATQFSESQTGPCPAKPCRGARIGGGKAQGATDAFSSAQLALQPHYQQWKTTSTSRVRPVTSQHWKPRWWRRPAACTQQPWTICFPQTPSCSMALSMWRWNGCCTGFAW